MAKIPLWLSVLETTTVTAPAALAGVVAVIDVPLTTVTPVAAVPPKLTVAPAKKFVPVSGTPVPPLSDPDFGNKEVTVARRLEPIRRTKLASYSTAARFKMNSM